MSHNPMGLHGLLQDSFTFTFLSLHISVSTLPKVILNGFDNDILVLRTSVNAVSKLEKDKMYIICVRFNVVEMLPF
jgi:hypothetical protein